MTELDIARQIRDGLLPSPWQLGGMTLFALRITGTGLSYRSGRDEFVWRDGSIYLNPEFLARCNGLSVIWIHPDKPALDSEEYNKRSIGQIVLPYIKGDEVWGIAKIYDDEAIEKMSKGQLSTSPGVVFLPGDGNEKVKLNGENFLIEGNPSLLDHLAVVEAGVWDIGGPPTGVQNDNFEGLANMADETETEKKAREEREDRARRDSERLDAILDGMSKMSARMDAMEAEKDKARHDAEEDLRRHDEARKDRFGHRKDGESYKDWKARHDADEMAMMDALCKGGTEMDKARKDARDCRMDAEEGEKKEGGESFKKWAEEEAHEPEHEKDKARKDAEEKERMEREEREDKARHDAQTRESADLRRQVAALTATLNTLTTEVPAGERDALAKAQARADSAAAMHGEEAPRPIPGETSLAYRRRLLEKFKAHSAQFKDTRFDSADGAMLAPIEGIIYDDVVKAAKTTAQSKVGLLIPYVRHDQAGRQITEYYGDPLAWMRYFMSGGQTGRFREKSNDAR